MALKKKRKESRFAIKQDYVISPENSFEQVKKYCEKHKIKTVDIDGDIDENLENTLLAISEFISLGYLKIEESGTFTQILQNPPGDVGEIPYMKMTGKLKRSIDGFDGDQNMARMYALLGAASGLGSAAIETLSDVDLKVAEALSIVFLS